MRIAILLLCAGLGLPAAAQTAAVLPSPQAASREFLWEVSSLTNKVYLYGTVHAGKESFYPLPEPVRKAFADAKVLAVEADITDVEAMAKGASSMGFARPAAPKGRWPTGRPRASPWRRAPRRRG